MSPEGFGRGSHFSLSRAPSLNKPYTRGLRSVNRGNPDTAGELPTCDAHVWRRLVQALSVWNWGSSSAVPKEGAPRAAVGSRAPAIGGNARFVNLSKPLNTSSGIYGGGICAPT